MGQSSPMDSKYNKSKARKDAIKPALAFFTGLGSVFLVLHYAFGNKPIRRLPPTQAQTALQSLQTLPGAAFAAAVELPEAFRTFQGPNEAQLRAARFTMSQHDSVDCPRGSKPLENPESCEIASEVLRVKYTGEQRFATDPTGCLYRTPDKDILWNQEQGGAASVVRKVVCLDVASLPASSLAAPAPVPAPAAAPVAAAPAPAQPTGTEEVTLKMRSEDGRFAITDTDANYCPSGSFPLQSKEDCQLAAKSFSKGFLPDTAKEELEPTGCVFRGPDQDMLWNEDPEGSPHESRHVVCATAQFQREKAAAKAAKAAEVPAAPAESPAPVLTDAPAAPAPAAPAPAAAAADAKYVFGSPGEVDCSPGAVPLSDQDQCEAAAKALSKEYVELNPAEGDPPGDDRQRFQVVLKALAAVDSRLLSSEEVWDIFQRLVLSSDTPLEEGFRLLIEAFDDEHWLTMARLSGCQLEEFSEFSYPTSEVRTVEEAPSEKAPRARIRNLTPHLMDLKLLAPVPSADRSAEVLREPFRFLRKSKRQAAAAERRRELPRAMASAVKSGTSGGASSPLTSANDYEAAIAERLATMKPNFGPVRILLQQAMGKGLKLSLNTWASVMSSFASRGVEGLSTVEKLQKLFRASGPVLMEREDFHRAMQLAAEAGDLEHVADLFNDMVCKGFEAQEDSYTLVFKACRRHGLDFSTKSFAEKYFYAMMSMGMRLRCLRWTKWSANQDAVF